MPLPQRGKIAKIIALNKCGRDSQCIEQVELDSLAFELAPQKNYNYNQCSSTFPNIFNGNIREQKAPHYITQAPQTFDRNNLISNYLLPIKERFNEFGDCGCSQTYNYWVLGISITFLVLFVICIIVFYMKKK